MHSFCHISLAYRHSSYSADSMQPVQLWFYQRSPWSEWWLGESMTCASLRENVRWHSTKLMFNWLHTRITWKFKLREHSRNDITNFPFKQSSSFVKTSKFQVLGDYIHPQSIRVACVYVGKYIMWITMEKYFPMLSQYYVIYGLNSRFQYYHFKFVNAYNVPNGDHLVACICCMLLILRKKYMFVRLTVDPSYHCIYLVLMILSQYFWPTNGVNEKSGAPGHLGGPLAWVPSPVTWRHGVSSFRLSPLLKFWKLIVILIVGEFSRNLELVHTI